MLWSELMAELDATVLVPSADFDVQAIAAADLLSDILASEKENFIILTGQTSAPAIRTALADQNERLGRELRRASCHRAASRRCRRARRHARGFATRRAGARAD